MHAYVEKLDFKELEIDDALRKLLSGFKLPGEAQKIDRIMEKFAEKFCKDNPNMFDKADTAYVLSYSIIMLNTDAHNPMVKNKMSREGFLKNNRRIPGVDELDDDFLTKIYDRITSNEIKMDHSNSPAPSADK